jgi:hypothetical protein
MNSICPKCHSSGWYQYDDMHFKICEVCCQHEQGWWLLQEYYGEDNGKYACKKGCGKTTTEFELANNAIKKGSI